MSQYKNVNKKCKKFQVIHSIKSCKVISAQQTCKSKQQTCKSNCTSCICCKKRARNQKRLLCTCPKKANFIARPGQKTVIRIAKKRQVCDECLSKCRCKCKRTLNHLVKPSVQFIAPVRRCNNSMQESIKCHDGHDHLVKDRIKKINSTECSDCK